MGETTGSILATAVGLGFVWSTVLFFAAVAIRERKQEDGFGWALAGAGLYFVVFCDRLPGEPTWPRDFVSVLPGVAQGAEAFQSSLVALLVLFVLYVFRIAVFYGLFMQAEILSTRVDSAEEQLNDYFAPLISFVCFAICLVCLVSPAYQLGIVWTVALSIAIAVMYYASAQLAERVRVAVIIVVVKFGDVREKVIDLVIGVVIAAARFEERRRGGATLASTRRWDDLHARRDERRREARARAHSRIEDAIARMHREDHDEP